MTLRPIGPRDASVLQAYVRGLSPESRYNRFFGALYELPPAELDRVIHLDRKYELALLAEARVDGAPIVIGEARYALAPDRLEGEFALSVADDWRGKGLGTLLMADIECRARLGKRDYMSQITSGTSALRRERNSSVAWSDDQRTTVCGLVRTKPETQLLLRLGIYQKRQVSCWASRGPDPWSPLLGGERPATPPAGDSALRVQRRSPSPVAHRACAIGSHATLLSARRGSSNAALRLA